ncbi:DNA-binding response regulator [Paenibacillus agaridevorans]|uniref:DNA-binding response regulator n=1 Tax=Paenibacillus agaridevorans TaxID=171404 RepID=A0A2R5EGD1_9BACL|nr:response regulator [Paenibacillus agaridevorans]GBG05616.1 DNA-binding response regulator [Paenibacillus agaridevorans]
MYKLLLIDDEQIILDGLVQKIDWAGQRMELAATATNALSALRLVEELKPDIVLTDIRMPGMDGIELIQHLKQLHPQLLCIILSGYGDFDYAKRAIQFGVEAYLLKPVRDAELNRTLAEMVGKLEKKNLEDSYVTSLRHNYKKQQQSMLSLSLTRLISGSALPEDLAQLPELLLGGTGYAVLVDMETVKYPHLGFREEEQSLFHYCVLNIIENCLSLHGIPGIVFKHAFNRYEFVALIGSVSTRDNSAYLQEAIVHIARYLRVDVTVGVGTPFRRLTELGRSYTEARQASLNKVLRGGGVVYKYKLATRHSDQHTLSADEQRMLVHCLETHNVKTIADWLIKRLRLLAEDNAVGYQELQQFMEQIMETLQLFRQKTGFDASMEDRPAILHRESDMEAIYVELLQLFEYFALRPQTGSRLTGEQIVEEVIRYIDQHYNEDISLQWISATYYIHANYFSRIFKEKAGVTLSEYILQTRMKQAMQLIKETPLQIKEIAQLVGYEQPAYFSLIFRKTFGISPIQLRGAK